jgi:tetratricopeptide (TPR) repeat protein
MKKVVSVVCLCALAGLALVIVAQIGCKAATSDELPITTKSKEARKLFVEGLDLYDFYHIEKASDRFKRAFESDPDFATAYLFHAVTTTETKVFQASLAKAIELAPRVSEGEQKLIAAVKANAEENNAEKAARIFKELSALYPKDKRIHLYLAGMYGGLNKYDDQLAEIEQAIAIDKNYAPAHEALGYFYRWRGPLDKSEAAFKEYARLSPAEANSHDVLGDVYMKMGRFEDAIKHYEEAVRMDPSFFYSQQKTGSCLSFLGRYEDARQAFSKAMDLPVKPVNKVYDQEGIVRTYIYEGDYPKALEAADKAIQMAKDLGLPEEASYTPLVKSFVYCELGDFDKADAAIGECLGYLDSAELIESIKSNQRCAATFMKSMVAARRNDFETALAQAASFKDQIAAINNPAIQKQPGWLLGCIALAQGDANKAIEYFSQGEMDDVFIMYQYAAAKEMAGDAAGAAELYKKVATWNLDGAWYAFVRQKAIDKLK